MSGKSVPVIHFLGYRVTDILYHCDSDFEFPNGERAYKFNFSKTNILLSERQVQENVRVNVFYGEEDDPDAARYHLSIEIAGRFECTADWEAQWETNAMAILFPYLRGLVSMITSNSGREPVILPTVNLASLFEKEENGEERIS